MFLVGTGKLGAEGFREIEFEPTPEGRRSSAFSAPFIENGGRKIYRTVKRFTH